MEVDKCVVVDEIMSFFGGVVRALVDAKETVEEQAKAAARQRKQQRQQTPGISSAETPISPSGDQQMRPTLLQNSGIRARLAAVLDLPGNQRCSECDRSDNKPHSAAFFEAPVDGEKLGIFVCKKCRHTALEATDGDFTVKHLKLLDNWSDADITVLELTGNNFVNTCFEARLRDEKEGREYRKYGYEAFFFEKYVNRRYFDKHVYRPLISAAKENLMKRHQEEANRSQRKNGDARKAFAIGGHDSQSNFSYRSAGGSSDGDDDEEGEKRRRRSIGNGDSSKQVPKVVVSLEEGGEWWADDGKSGSKPQSNRDDIGRSDRSEGDAILKNERMQRQSSTRKMIIDLRDRNKMQMQRKRLSARNLMADGGSGELSPRSRRSTRSPRRSGSSRKLTSEGIASLKEDLLGDKGSTLRDNKNRRESRNENSLSQRRVLSTPRLHGSSSGSRRHSSRNRLSSSGNVRRVSSSSGSKLNASFSSLQLSYGESEGVGDGDLSPRKNATFEKVIPKSSSKSKLTEKSNEDVLLSGLSLEDISSNLLAKNGDDVVAKFNSSIASISSLLDKARPSDKLDDDDADSFADLIVNGSDNKADKKNAVVQASSTSSSHSRNGQLNGSLSSIGSRRKSTHMHASSPALAFDYDNLNDDDRATQMADAAKLSSSMSVLQTKEGLSLMDDSDTHVFT